jgi:Predicted membrane protein/domain
MTTYDEYLTDLDRARAEGCPLEKNTVQYRAAGFWIRLVAFIIDLLVIAGLNSIIWNSLLPESNQASFLYKIWHTNALFLGVTGAFYFILMTRYFQQTLGKMILGIKVVQPGGEPLGWVTVIFRELVARSLSQLMGLNLGYAVCWFNVEKRCAHDFLSDTWVVFEKPAAESNLIKI